MQPMQDNKKSLKVHYSPLNLTKQIKRNTTKNNIRNAKQNTISHVKPINGASKERHAKQQRGKITCNTK